MNRMRLFGVAVTILGSLSATTGAYALNFDLGNGISLDWDTTLRYSVAQRIEDRDSKLIADPNSDDGNRNFDRWSLIKNRFDVLTEADLNFGEVGPLYNFGLFTRAHGWYDFVYNQSNDHDSPLTSNNISVAYDSFTDKTEKWHGRKVEMLDYFLYSGFDVGGLDTS
ncbi:DUF1302 domain-containing protein, partial [Desulforhopalus singaporensis]